MSISVKIFSIFQLFFNFFSPSKYFTIDISTYFPFIVVKKCQEISKSSNCSLLLMRINLFSKNTRISVNWKSFKIGKKNTFLNLIRFKSIIISTIFENKKIFQTFEYTFKLFVNGRVVSLQTA